MGFEVKRFKNPSLLKRNPLIFCSFCQKVLKEPMMASTCQHMFCRQCIEPLVRSEAQCPQDGQPLLSTHVRECPPGLREVVGNLEMSCDFSAFGCNETITISQMSIHCRDCPFNPDALSEDRLEGDASIDQNNRHLDFGVSRFSELINERKAMIEQINKTRSLKSMDAMKQILALEVQTNKTIEAMVADLSKDKVHGLAKCPSTAENRAELPNREDDYVDVQHKSQALGVSFGPIKREPELDDQEAGDGEQILPHFEDEFGDDHDLPAGDSYSDSEGASADGTSDREVTPIGCNPLTVTVRSLTLNSRVTPSTSAADDDNNAVRIIDGVRWDRKLFTRKGSDYPVLVKRLKYPCPLCFKNFTRESHLMAHHPCYYNKLGLNEKDKSLTYECVICHKKCRELNHLRQHLSIHTDENLCRCTLCDKMFRREDDVISHFRQHTGERPYQCSHCHKRFAQSFILQQHILIHTGEKKVKCVWPGCGKTFYSNGQKSLHMKRHRKEKDNKCPVVGCDASFVTKYEVNRHVKKHHSDQVELLKS